MDKIAFKDNLTNPFTKTLQAWVFDSHRDVYGVRCTPSLLKASGRFLGFKPCIVKHIARFVM